GLGLRGACLCFTSLLFRPFPCKGQGDLFLLLLTTTRRNECDFSRKETKRLAHLSTSLEDGLRPIRIRNTPARAHDKTQLLFRHTGDIDLPIVERNTLQRKKLRRQHPNPDECRPTVESLLIKVSGEEIKVMPVVAPPFGMTRLQTSGAVHDGNPFSHLD